MDGPGATIATNDGERHDVWESFDDVVQRLRAGDSPLELTTGASRRRLALNPSNVAWVEDRGPVDERGPAAGGPA